MDKNIPNHVAIILDGNRRHALRQGFDAYVGHETGFERVREIWPYARSVGIKYLTLWAFSTENWERPYLEVSAIMALLKRALVQIQAEMHEKQARFVAVGRRDRLSPDILNLITTIEAATKQYSSFCVIVAVDYGGRDEIRRAGEKLTASGDKSKQVEDFSDMAEVGVPPIDCIIRTGGEKRTSGFAPFSDYAEWLFPDTLLPQFGVAQFQEALDEYARRPRRFGK